MLTSAVLVAAPALAACGGSSGPATAAAAAGKSTTTTTSSSSNTTEPTTPPPTPVTVTLQPTDGAQDVAPAVPPRVSATNGTLADVALTNPTGKQVAGALAQDRRSWTVTEALGYDKTYTWSGTAIGANGMQTPLAGSFHTIRPRRQISGSLNIGDNETVGIAMPVTLTFGAAVNDRAAVEKALSVQTSVPTEGAWAWLDDRRVHWRPKDYWKPGTTVTVNAKVYGVAFGNGAFGADDVSSTFTIGRAQIVKADTQTHRLMVIRDGQQVADYPASYGLESDPGRVTHSGIHVVMSKSDTFSMCNPTYHYCDVVVPWAVRISDNGEFIHGYAPSIYAQGVRNVSHGCANLSPANAKEYYDGAMNGDPVEITGSSVPLSADDGDFYDWTIPWDQWKSMSALG
jgi:lipoprotein-anchoring transpeptidase ErfK/SrfK